MTVVKICGLATVDDARRAWRCGADLLGFVMVPGSPRFVDVNRVAAIVQALDAEGCDRMCVGVFVAGRGVAVADAVRACGLDAVQVHGEGSRESVHGVDVPVILAHRVGERVPWEALADEDVWAHLLDTRRSGTAGGTGITWTWGLLDEGLVAGRRIMVAGGLDADNVGTLVSTYHPWGVDVSSGVERIPGRKDPDKVRRFIENVREHEESS